MERSQNFALLLYPDDDTHCMAVARLMDDGNNYQYALILHDADTYEEDNAELGHVAGEIKKAHWHVVLSFRNQRTISVVASELGLRENYLRYIGRDQSCAFLSRADALAYLTHAHEPCKHHYSRTEVYGPLAYLVPEYLEEPKDESARVIDLLELLHSLPVPCPYKTVIKRSAEAGLYDVLRRMGSLATKVIDEHNHVGGIID